MKKCCVVGSGLGGLTSAHILSSKYQVTILEKANYIGMDVASVTINNHRIDAPMRSIQKQYYPTLYSLYEYLGIEKRMGRYESCFYTWVDKSMKLTFIKPQIFGLKSQWALIDVLKYPILSVIVIFEMIRLFVHCYYLTFTNQLTSMNCTFGEFLTENLYSKVFLDSFLVPFLVNVGTCTHETLLNYPAKIAIHMIASFDPEFEQVVGGVQTVCQKLLKNVYKIEYGIDVVSCFNRNDMIIVVDQFGLEREFDYVIFATQGLVAQKILKNGNQKLYDCLGKFEYKPVRVVIHSDDSVMPRDKVDWRGLNITFDGKESMASMWINFIYDLPTSMPDYFETSNLFVEPLSIDKSKIINEYVFPRSFVTMESCDALDVLEQCQGINGFFFVGSWVWPGMPLLEGCVASSVRVAERLGIQRPWKLTENECKPWSKSEELLEVGLVDRFLSNDLCVEKSKSGVMKSIVLAFMHVYLVTLNVFLHLIRYIQ